MNWIEFQALNTYKIKTKDKHTADNHLTTTNVSQNFAARFLKSFLNMKTNKNEKSTKKSFGTNISYKRLRTKKGCDKPIDLNPVFSLKMIL